MKNGKGLRNGDFLHTENTQLTSCLTGLDFAKQVNLLTVVFLKKMGQPRPLLHLFLLFSNKQYKFYNKSIRKNVMSIQYPVPGFKPMTFGT